MVPRPTSGKHARIYDAIYADPVRSSIVWADIVSLFSHLGCKVTQGEGSRVRVSYGQHRGLFHRPHPEKETDKGAVKSVRRFLDQFVSANP